MLKGTNPEKKSNSKKNFKKLIRNNKGGSLIEYGICIGLAIFILYLIIDSIDKIIYWLNSNIDGLISMFSL